MGVDERSSALYENGMDARENAVVFLRRFLRGHMTRICVRLSEGLSEEALDLVSSPMQRMSPSSMMLLYDSCYDYKGATDITAPLSNVVGPL